MFYKAGLNFLYIKYATPAIAAVDTDAMRIADLYFRIHFLHNNGLLSVAEHNHVLNRCIGYFLGNEMKQTSNKIILFLWAADLCMQII